MVQLGAEKQWVEQEEEEGMSAKDQKLLENPQGMSPLMAPDLAEQRSDRWTGCLVHRDLPAGGDGAHFHLGGGEAG